MTAIGVDRPARQTRGMLPGARSGPAIAVVAALAAAVASLAPSPAGAQMPCENLVRLSLPATILSAAVAPTGAYCQVRGTFPPSENFEVWLPIGGWNGKFLGGGNLGNAGYVDTAFGMPPALARGYATASTDTGHRGGLFDESWALGHPELQIEFGHRAIHVMTELAKAIVEAFYGSKPTRSYFVGCSCGG